MRFLAKPKRFPELLLSKVYLSESCVLLTETLDTVGTGAMVDESVMIGHVEPSTD
ncbi:hypothetical protein DPMN_028147 [Dreissena polymorpha]|uniref:Uncharacterized protein n=1 Tax=Dreissena polymorpha TaxID=45954 RepID=A0A9D4RF19_DREPO|nr:hypothetical protein DPMN_028147 [Dreissena polymorpha]